MRPPQRVDELLAAEMYLLSQLYLATERGHVGDAAMGDQDDDLEILECSGAPSSARN